jgi:hypothetical protein
MLGRAAPLIAFVSVLVATGPAWAMPRVHHNAMSICALIINEMTEGKVGVTRAREISLAIAHAANRHFGRVTCGDMWLYMAIAYVESGFKSNVVNHYNCRGLFQVHAPSWARKFGVSYKDLLELDTNADVGIQVWKYYLGTYKRLVPALSAYNSDHPRAAIGYAFAVLSARKRIKERYTELHNAFKSAQTIAYSSSNSAMTAPAVPNVAAYCAESRQPTRPPR